MRLYFILIISLSIFSQCQDSDLPPQLQDALDNHKTENHNKTSSSNIEEELKKITKTKEQETSRLFENNLHTIAKKILPAVVDIRAERIRKDVNYHNFPYPFHPFSDRFFDKRKGQKEEKAQSIGSGFIISNDGYIITNNHVIDGAEEITVHLSNDQNYKAKVVGKDEISDLAVIQIKTNSSLPTLKFADPKSIQVGHFAIAVGNPFGLKGSFTFGVISALGRTEGNIDKNAVFKHFIQTDAPINQGNSGGPLVNIKGNVIGVNTAILASRNQGSIGIGFAIPVGITQSIVQQLISKGQVDRGYIGVLIENVEASLAEHHNLEDSHGVLIKNVEPEGPADKAGIEPGDIVLEINQRFVKDTTDLIQRIAGFLPGDEVRLTILHKGEKVERVIYIGKRPKKITWFNQNKNTNHPGQKTFLGLKLASVQEYQKHFNLNATDGVVIIGIDKGSPADNASENLYPGDVIESINSNPVVDLNSLAMIIEKEADQKSYLVHVLRNGKRFFSVLKKK